MIDAVLPIVCSASSLNVLMDLRYADYGDTIKFTVSNKALYHVTKASFKKRHAEVQKTYRTDVTLNGENHKVTVMADLYDILQGSDYIAYEVMKSAVSIEQAIFAEGYTALKSALTLKVKEKELKVFHGFEFVGKTKEAVKFLTAIKAEKKVLLVTADDLLIQAANNLSNVILRTANNISVYDLLNANHLVISENDIKSVEEALK